MSLNIFPSDTGLGEPSLHLSPPDLSKCRYNVAHSRGFVRVCASRLTVTTVTEAAGRTE